MTIAFEESWNELEDNPQTATAAIVVVVGSIESGVAKTLRRLRDVFPAGRIIFCSEPVEALIIRRAIDLGVDGVVWSHRLETSLEAAIWSVHAGCVVVPREPFQKPRVPDLTNREKQSLSMVIMGLTNGEIAEKLFISENTVKSHLNTAYRKLGVHSRAEAQRLITDPDRGLGAGILAITASGLSRGRPPRKEPDDGA